MDQFNAAINANLNLLVVVGLLCFGIAFLALSVMAMSIWSQVNRTLYAYEKLATTVSTELQPTLAEAGKLVGSVLKLQDIAHNSIGTVSTKVEDVTDNLTKAASDAKKSSHVIGAGVLAGIKAYLNSHKGESHHSS
jgi:uncharacterized protein YoxC